MSFSPDNYLIVSRLLCKPNGTTVKEIANALGVTERHVHNVLDQMYAVLYFDTVPDPVNSRVNRYVAIGDSPRIKLPDLNLTDEEIALFNQLMETAELTPALKETGQKLFSKIQTMASERGKKIKIENNSRRLILNAATITKQIGENGTENATRIIREILGIIKNQYWMDIEYRPMKSVDSINWEKLYPLQLFTSNGDTYLYVLTRKKDLKMLAIERLIKINAAYPGERVEVLYDFRKLLSDPFGIMPEKLKPYKVILWVNDWETKYLKDKDWPDSVKITTNDDGSSIFEAETRTHYECIAWIQARIDRVKILEPQWLKDEIMANLNKAIAQNT